MEGGGAAFIVLLLQHAARSSLAASSAQFSCSTQRAEARDVQHTAVYCLHCCVLPPMWCVKPNPR